MHIDLLANSFYMKFRLSTVAHRLSYPSIYHNPSSTRNSSKDLPSLSYSLWELINYQTELPKAITLILVFQTMSKLSYFSQIPSPRIFPYQRPHFLQCASPPRCHVRNRIIRLGQWRRRSRWQCWAISVDVKFDTCLIFFFPSPLEIKNV